MIGFSTLQELAIPEGVVTQIADASGKILWKLESSIPAVLQVAKITADTRANGTTHVGDQFVSLNIYPKTKGTVKVTYGGFSKTITDKSGVEKPNAQQVYFGTFNGVPDREETPASGTLTIEGDYYAFGIGTYEVEDATSSKTTTKYCSCITAVDDFGSTTEIPSYAFYECSLLTYMVIPDSVTSIGSSAFYNCSKLNLGSLPNGLIDIGNSAFAGCSKIRLGEIPNGVKSIGSFAFEMPRLFEDLSTNMPNEIILPSTVETIGDRPFYYYDRNGRYHSYIANYYVYATTPPVLEGQYGLAETGIVNIYVPKGCVDLYKSAEGWSKHAYEIKEMPQSGN